uniref:PLD phosphodiesterase domain-containing protein n=1 Tax=Chondromyces crocatus TaxID=52 RepID=D7P602_CHOCO|nr:unknown [Chondromyces crocatus]
MHLHSDPAEQALRFRDEAIQALQRTPVTCIVDGGCGPAGQRLPYDRLEVHGRVFHPKLVLLLFGKFARLQVGSGNLTPGGYGGNTELFFVRDLHYEAPEEATILHEVNEFLGQVATIVQSRGTQLDRIREDLTRRLGPKQQSSDRPAFVFLHSMRAPILDQFLDLVPREARVTRVGVMAPFFEADDADAMSIDELRSVLKSLTTARPGDPPRLDIGLLWDDAPNASTPPTPLSLTQGCNQLWRIHRGSDEEVTVDYLTLLAVTTAQVQIEDRHGESRRRPRQELEEALEEGKARPVQGLAAYAPRRILELIEEHGSHVHIWLHPASRLEEGVPVHRPLHAKLITLTVKHRRKELTYVLVGSPNASRRALLQTAADGGNVEIAAAFMLEGALALHDFAPELVHGRRETIKLTDRHFPPTMPNLAAWIESAIHDAAEQRLDVTWARRGPAPLGPFQLRYAKKTLLSGDRPPSGTTTVEGFTLQGSNCELVLTAHEQEFMVPIHVLDLAMLPTNPALVELELRELLALLGHRLGAERLATLKNTPGGVSMSVVLETIFGEGFGPVDVFKAWWGLERELADETLSVAAFRLLLVSPVSAGAVWDRMLKARDTPGGLTRDETWFYGAELLHVLTRTPIPEDASAPKKREILDEFTSKLRADLAELRPGNKGRPWVKDILKHYGVTT